MGLPSPRQLLYYLSLASKNSLRQLEHAARIHSQNLTSRFLKLAILVGSFRCNLRCRMCMEWGESGLCHNADGSLYSPLPELDELTGLRLVRDLSILKPDFLSFSGGEPLLYRHLFSLAHEAKKKGLRTLASTNGMFLKEHAKEVVSSFDALQVSLDGPEPVHDAIRRCRGSYSKVLEGIEGIVKERSKKKGVFPLIEIICIIGEENTTHLVPLVKELRSLFPIDAFYFRHTFFTSERAAFATDAICAQQFEQSNYYWQGYLYQPKVNVRRLQEEIRELKERFSISVHPEMTQEELELYYSDPEYTPPYTFCHGPWTQCTILPSGHCFLCPGVVLGDIHQASLLELFNNETAKKNRRYLLDHGIFPACRACCHLLENGDGVGAARSLQRKKSLLYA